MSDLRVRQSLGHTVSSLDESKDINSASSGERRTGDGFYSSSSAAVMDGIGQRTSIDINDDDAESKLLGGGNSMNDIVVDDEQNIDEDGEGDLMGGPKVRVIRVFGRSINVVVAVTHLNVFLYATCFWIQNAVFPYLSKQLGADPVTFGYLQTTFAIVQLAGGPLFGRFGDIFGSRMAMTLAFASSATSYFFLYIATSIPLLFLSRLPSVFMHAMQGGQMIVTDVCDSKERANALAKLGLSYGLGMVVGTLAGGLIAKLFSLETGALIASMGSVLSVVLIYTNIPAKVKRVKVNKGQGQDSVFSVSKILELLRAPGAFFLMSVKVGTGIPIGIFQSMFSIVALETFQLSADKNSYMMSYIGVLSMLVQGLAVGAASKRFSDLHILTGSAALLAVSYFLLSQVTSIWQMCIVFLPLVTGLTFQTVITTSALTNTVNNADTGAMLGLSMAVNSMIRSLSPTVGGYMLGSLGFPSFGYLGFVTSAVVTAVLLMKLRKEER